MPPHSLPDPRGTSERPFKQGRLNPLAAAGHLNGDATHPLYQWLKKNARGLLGSERIKWNFTKFLVDRQGNAVDRYAPLKKPQDLAKHIEALL